MGPGNGKILASAAAFTVQSSKFRPSSVRDDGYFEEKSSHGDSSNELGRGLLAPWIAGSRYAQML